MIQKIQTVTLQYAETQLAQLVEQAAHGEAFIISKAGRPMVKVVPFETTAIDTAKQLGFMTGEISVPDDFDNEAFIAKGIAAQKAAQQSGNYIDAALVLHELQSMLDNARKKLL